MNTVSQNIKGWSRNIFHLPYYNSLVVNQAFPSKLIVLWEIAPFFTRNFAISIPLVTHSPCSACCPSVLTWHCIDSLNCFLLLRTTPCSTCGHRQRYLAPVPSLLVHASHRRYTRYVLMLDKQHNLHHFTSLQMRLGTAKTLPPNTSLSL